MGAPFRLNNEDAAAPNSVRMGCTMLAQSGKKGVIEPDADGYYILVVGSYGTYNSAGMFYDMASGVSMFQPDTPLMRRLNKGVLYMEYKHPEPFFKDGRRMGDMEYLSRIRQIDDDRVCAHIRALTIVDGVDENGKPVKLVIAEVKPYGPYGKYMEASLRNPHQNTYCSVRSITRDNMATGVKYTQEISTWDMVGEGGIYTANKYNSPACEAYSVATEAYDKAFAEKGSFEVELTPATLMKTDREFKRLKGLGLESVGHLDTSDLRRKLGWETDNIQRRPAYMRWT